MTDKEKESLIEQALNTKEGHAALAEAMVQPIRQAMFSKGFLRSILFCEEIKNEGLEIIKISKSRWDFIC